MDRSAGEFPHLSFPKFEKSQRQVQEIRKVIFLRIIAPARSATVVVRVDSFENWIICFPEIEEPLGPPLKEILIKWVCYEGQIKIKIYTPNLDIVVLE